MSAYRLSQVHLMKTGATGTHNANLVLLRMCTSLSCLHICRDHPRTLTISSSMSATMTGMRSYYEPSYKDVAMACCRGTAVLQQRLWTI